MNESIEWIEPSSWRELGALGFRLKALPEQEFVLVFPEWFTAREMSTHARFTWEDFPTSRAWQEKPFSAGLRFRLEEFDRNVHLGWEYTFTNGGNGTLTDLAAFNCLNLDRAPLFKDLAMERTRVTDAQGHGTVLDDVPKVRGPGKRTMQFYPAAGGIDLNRIDKIKSYGVNSPAKLRGDRVTVTSRDGSWRLESIVDGPVAYFFSNWEPDHGCVHAAPSFGTIGPDQTATAQGRIALRRVV